MNLRSYQSEAVNTALRLIETKEIPLFASLMPTGTGKSNVLASILYESLYNKLVHKVLICVPSIAVENQLLEAFSEIRVNDSTHSLSEIYQIEVVSKLNKDALLDSNDTSVNLATIQRIRQKPELIATYDLIVLFETSLSIEQIPELTGRGTPVFFLGNSMPSSMERLFGEPIFQYSLEQAFSDGYLQLPEIYSLNTFKKNEPVSIKGLEKVLPHIFENFDDQRKILIVCKNGDDAQRVYELIQNDQNLTNFNGINLLTAKTTNLNSEIRRFKNERKPQITISVKTLYHGYDIPGVTDIILLKYFSSSRELIDATKFALRLSSHTKQKKVIWDLYSNSGLTKQFGEPITAFTKEYNSDNNTNYTKTESSENTGDIIEKLFQSNKLIKPNGDSVSNDDYLNRDYVVNTLKGLVEHSSESVQYKPFVFGLFGKWGTGKSTIINLLKQKFNNNTKFKFIEYNAWRNEHCLNITASIANTITDTLYEKRNLFSRIMLAFKSQVLQKKDTITVSIFLISVLALFVVTFMDTSKIPLLKNSFVSGVLDDYKYLLSFVAFITATTWSFFKLPFTSKIKKLAEKPGFSQYLGVSEEIRGQVNALFDACTSINWFWLKEYKPEQYVLIIDDLDRCDHKSILQALEAVRVLSERPDMIVIICVDKTVLLNSVIRKYQESEIKQEEDSHVTARNFLAKIFQLSYELIDDQGTTVNKFIEKRIYPPVKINSNKKVKVLAKETINEEVDEEDNVEYEDDSNENASSIKSLADSKIIPNEFVEPAPGEKEEFIKCAELFDFNNPRTLIRLHNTITLIKGMYSEKVNTTANFPHLIFATFFFEYLCSNSINQYTNAKILKENKASEYMEGAKIDLNSQNFKEIMAIVSKASLPSGNPIEP